MARRRTKHFKFKSEARGKGVMKFQKRKKVVKCRGGFKIRFKCE